MITTIIFDFSRVLLFPKDNNYIGKLNPLYKENKNKEDFNFFNYFRLNKELLEFLTLIKDKYTLCIFTSDIIQKDVSLKQHLDPVFKNVYSAKDFNVEKNQKSAYNIIAETIAIPTENILFIDDSGENIEAASEAGMKTIQYKNNDDFLRDIKQKLSI